MFSMRSPFRVLVGSRLSLGWSFGLVAAGVLSGCSAGAESDDQGTAGDQSPPYAADPPGIDEFLGGTQDARPADQRPVSDVQHPTGSDQDLEQASPEYEGLTPEEVAFLEAYNRGEVDLSDPDDDEEPESPDGTVGKGRCKQLCADAEEAGCTACMEICTNLPETCASYVGEVAACAESKVRAGQECQAAIISCSLEGGADSLAACTQNAPDSPPGTAADL